MASSIEMDPRERRRRASEEAAEWWVSLLFVDWLRESPLHVAEILRMAQVDDALTEFRRWHDIDAMRLQPRTS